MLQQLPGLLGEGVVLGGFQALEEPRFVGDRIGEVIRIGLSISASGSIKNLHNLPPLTLLSDCTPCRLMEDELVAFCNDCMAFSRTEMVSWASLDIALASFKT